MSPGLASISRIQKAHRRDWDDGNVIFRGQSISAVVQKDPTLTWNDGEKPNGKGNVDFKPKDFVTVRVLKEDLESAPGVYDTPRVGEFFVADGVRHRIQEVRGFKISWLCLCKTGVVQ
jgi:hypothetical protein